MRKFCPLASGSRGNAIYVRSEKTSVLIDAGISSKSLISRLEEIEVDPKSLEAILITHEHIDHIAGLKIFAERYDIAVFANAETAKAISELCCAKLRFKIFSTGESFHFKDLLIRPFSVPHDTLDPVGFTICTGDTKLGFCTDLGHVTSLIKKELEGCDYLYLEANHEPSMVHACARPAVYKTRVLGKLGHLSNAEVGKLLASIAHPKLKHVHLAHLSSECNAEEVALQTVRKALLRQEVELSIAYQDKISKSIYF